VCKAGHFRPSNRHFVFAWILESPVSIEGFSAWDRAQLFRRNRVYISADKMCSRPARMNCPEHRSKTRNPARRILFGLDSAHFSLRRVFTQMLAAVDSFQKPAIKGLRRLVRISEWVLPPGTRICIFAIVCLYPSYPIDRTGKMVRTLFYTYEARDTNVKIYSRKGG
jgi:hypothetical protein